MQIPSFVTGLMSVALSSHLIWVLLLVSKCYISYKNILFILLTLLSDLWLRYTITRFYFLSTLVNTAAWHHLNFSWLFLKLKIFVVNGSQLAKMKKVFLTCPCDEIYRDKTVGLKSCKYTWKNYDSCKYVEFGAISLKFESENSFAHVWHI